MTVQESGLVINPGEGQSYWVLGDLYTIKAAGADTGESYALFEFIIEPQNGPPPHIHSREDEAFYVQAGEIEFRLDGQIILGTPGTFLHSPKGQCHSFKNIGTSAAKMLCWVTPAGLEKFFAEIGTPASSQITVSPAVNDSDIQKILATAPKYGIEIIPPS